MYRHSICDSSWKYQKYQLMNVYPTVIQVIVAQSRDTAKGRRVHGWKYGEGNMLDPGKEWRG